MPNFIRKNFGCYQAIGLDNGGSMGMSYQGRVIKKPGRKIMDAFAVVEATPAQKRENAAIDVKVSAFNAKVAGQIRAMKKKGVTKVQVEEWKERVRNSLRASIKNAEAKSPASLDIRVMRGDACGSGTRGIAASELRQDMKNLRNFRRFSVFRLPTAR